jgi:hypothetical protein
MKTLRTDWTARRIAGFLVIAAIPAGFICEIAWFAQPATTLEATNPVEQKLISECSPIPGSDKAWIHGFADWVN